MKDSDYLFLLFQGIIYEATKLGLFSFYVKSRYNVRRKDPSQHSLFNFKFIDKLENPT